MVSSQLTYAELRARARAIAVQLKLAGAQGSRALLLFSPGLDFVCAFLGCLYAGVTAVPAYPPRKNNKMLRLQAIVQDAEAAAVLTTADLLAKITKWFDAGSPLADARWLAVDDISVNDIAGDDTAYKESLPIVNPLAFLQYTSGSTGTPKGVMVSQENITHNLKAIHRCFGHSLQSKGVIWLPPYHDMGLIGGILQPLYGGFEVTLMSPIDFLQKPLRWLQAISAHGATTSGGPDFAYSLCARKAQMLLEKETAPQPLADLDLSSWQVAFTGAEPVRADTLALFADVFAPYGFRPEAFYPCYGMAETTLIVSGGAVNARPVFEAVEADALSQRKVKLADAKSDQQVQVVVGCGDSLSDQRIEIVSPETKRRCLPGEVGEIWVKGKSVTQGYWKNVEETLRAYRAYTSDTGEGPFLRTGDLGFVGASHSPNELFVTGRIKDVMIIRGRNYYPQDVERTVEDAHPAIRQGAIAAFTVEESGAQQLIVVAEIERTHLRSLDVGDVSGAIRQAIAADFSLQVQTALLVKPGSIPKTSSGKIQRYRCRELFLAGDLTVIKDWSENPRHKREFVKLESDVNSIRRMIEGQKTAVNVKTNVKGAGNNLKKRNNSVQRVSL